MTKIAPAFPIDPATALPGAACIRTPGPTGWQPDRSGMGRRFGCPGMWGKTIELVSGQPEAFDIQSRAIADATFAEITAPPATITQDGPARGNAHRFHLVLLLKGYGAYSWAGGTATQNPGDIMLLDTTQPSQVVSAVDCQLLRWSFPEALIAPFLPLRESCAVLHLPARPGLMAVIAQHIRQLGQQAGQLDRAIQSGLLAHLCALLGLAIEANATPAPARRHNYRGFQRQRVLAYIETHLREPDCTAKRAARDLGMSVRWLHSLLEDLEESFADLMARRRLETSLALLEDPAANGRSIAEIAFESGFNDLSTFYRRFGDRYGMTPGKARRRACQGGIRKSARAS